MGKIDNVFGGEYQETAHLWRNNYPKPGEKSGFRLTSGDTMNVFVGSKWTALTDTEVDAEMDEYEAQQDVGYGGRVWIHVIAYAFGVNGHYIAELRVHPTEWRQIGHDDGDIMDDAVDEQLARRLTGMAAMMLGLFRELNGG